MGNRGLVRWVGRALAALLVASLLEQVPMAPAAAAADDRKARDLPALESVEQKKRVPKVPEGDFRNQPPLDDKPVKSKKDHSKSFDPAKSKVVKRSAKADVYENPDGTQTVVLRTSAVNWQDEKGDWHPIDRTLEADGGRWRNKSARVSVKLAGTSGDGPLAEVSADGWSVAYDLEGATPGVKPTVKDDKATYKDLLGDIDVEERVLPEGVKEELVLRKEPEGSDDMVLRFPLTLQGVTAAAQPDGTVAFSNAAGEKVAVAPRGVVWDAERAPAEGGGIVLPLALVPTTDGGRAVELRVPRTYLADPALRYPVRIDPGIDAGHATWQYDAFGSSYPGNENTNYNGALQWDGTAYVDMAGYDVFRVSEQYSYQYFDLTPILGKHILSAQWRDWVFSVRGSGYYRLWRVADSWTDSTVTWNNKPNHAGEYKEGWATAGNFQYRDMTDWTANWASGAWPSKGISIDSAGEDSGVRFAATEQGNTLNAAIYVTYNTPPTPGQQTAPDNGAVLMTDQPTLSGSPGSDVDGDPLCYWFRASTNPDGFTGSLLNSGCVGSPTWTAPAGSLVDGMTYHWRMYTFDGTDWAGGGDVRSFKVNLRLGRQGVSPMDSAGPASVNLANGNLVVQTSSRSLDTVGGLMGVSYTYNSDAQEQFGLIGTYTHTGSETYERLVRRDRQLDFNWGTGSPGPGVPADNFDVTWSGYITVPYQAGNWYFGAVHDDDVTIKVNGTVVYSAGCCRGSNDPGFGTWLSLYGGHTVPIEITLHEAGGLAYFQLWTMGPRYGIVPANWLSTTPPPLPQGWSLSVDAGGGELSYAKAVVGDNSLVLVEPSGVVHEYRKQSDLSWRPVDGDDDVVTTASESGTTVFVVQGADGIVYTFNGRGQLVRAVSSTDDRNPAAPIYEYNTTTARLKAVVDPVSGKRIELKYAFPPDGGTTVTTDCPKNAGAGLDKEPPIGMLCQVTYWDGSTTNLYYLGDVAETRVLARIEEPGGAVTDFGYDGNGRLVRMRDPLAADMVAAGSRADDDTTRTEVAYDGGGRAVGVKLPAPLAGDVRPEHAYTYASGTQTDLEVAGLLQPGVLDLARRVTFDAAGRLLTDRDTAGLITTNVWDSEDKLVSSTAPGGLKTTRVYDQADRPVESHGPAPSSCFGVAPTEPGWSGERPNGSCTNPAVPVSRTAYDEGIKGLAAEYWSNTGQSGASVGHGTAGDANGALVLNWAAGAPDGVLPQTDNWSSRFTGEITFPNPGTYSFLMCSDDGVRLFVDDVKLVDDWIGWAGCRAGTSTVSIGAADTRRRIRVDHMEVGGLADVGLYWTPPGAGQQVVPGQYLAPRYGLVTSTVDADGKKTSTEYARPEYGQATASVVDPDDGTGPAELNLRTVTAYEAPGTGNFRRTSKALPKGNATTFAYWAAGESTPSNECGGVPATGMFKSETGPTPGTGSAVTRRVVYDSLHRIVGRKVDGDGRWACTAYDSRGRVTAITDASDRTTTFTHSTPGQVTTGYVDSGGTARSTVEKLDLLGRTWSYRDEHSTTTRRTYDQAGRPTGVYRTFSGQSEATVQTFAYDGVGRLSSTTEHLSGGPRTTTYGYDSAGRPTTTTRPNGVTTTTGYDADRGDATSLSHTGAAMTASTWTYARSAARRVTSEATTGRARTFAYDGAGRLTRAVEGTVTRDYAYDANTNRCARTSDCTSPTYTYDSADRITSSPEYSSYVYDAHGNTTAAVPRTQPGPVSIGDAFSFDAGSAVTPRTYPITVGQAGTVSASVDWTNTGTAVTTGSDSGTVGAAPASVSNAAMTGPRPTDTALSGTLSWTKGAHPTTDTASVSVPAAGSGTRTITTAAAGTVSATMDWTTGTASLSDAGTVSTGLTTTVKEATFTASADGGVDLTLSWSPGAVNPDLDIEVFDAGSGALVASSTNTNTLATGERIVFSVSGLATYPSSRTYRYRVSAKPGSSSSFTLSGTYPVTPTMDLKLENTSGTVLASSTTASGLRRRTLSYSSAPAGTYVLRASSSDHAVTPSISATYNVLDWADLTLALKKGSTTLASTRSATGTATLTHTVEVAASTGSFSWVVTNNSADIPAPSYTLDRTVASLGRDTVSGSIAVLGTATRTVTADAAGHADVALMWTQATGLGFANLTVALKQGSTVLATATSATGSASLTTSVPAAGDYTVAITNNSATADVPSYDLTTRVPQKPPVGVDVVLKNAAGAVVASATGTKPRTLSASPAAGAYTLVVAPIAGKADATLSGSHPDHPNRLSIAYDTHAHAVRVDDGRTVVDETLAPSGRVLRRVVTDAATGAVAEDAVFGYDGADDSPAYSRPSGGGTVTTYLGDVVYTGIVAAWRLANLHGDVAGTTDAAGTFTAHPAADEFGVGQVPGNRLGWLGAHDRFAVGGRLGLIRMGVRLYDTNTGRFTSVDPVEGGSANDYDYGFGDPINNLDLTGLASERALNSAEKEALRRKATGKPYDRKAYNSARKKQTHNEKVRQERNRQKRQSNFSTTPTVRGQYLADRAARGAPTWGTGGGWRIPELPSWIPGGIVGGVIVACIWFCIPTPWPVL